MLKLFSFPARIFCDVLDRFKFYWIEHALVEADITVANCGGFEASIFLLGT